MPPITIAEPEISISQYHHFIFPWAAYSIDLSWIAICLSSLSCSLAPPEAYLPVEVRDNSQYANDDEINPYEVVKYLGENHDNDTENKRNYAPQQTVYLQHQNIPSLLLIIYRR